MPGLLKIGKICLLAGLNFVFFLVGLLINAAGFAGRERRAALSASCAGFWARASCRVLGVQITQSGMLRHDIPQFIVGNHCSYLDIIVIGSVVGRSVFVAKKEVASWFFLGPLATLAGTVFVDRDSKSALPDTIAEIQRKLNSGISVILFPEGTTGNGLHVMEFKSSFFKAPAEMNIEVLPVSLMYQYMDGVRVDHSTADRISWYGDMSFLPHFWNLLDARKIEARIHFNPAIRRITSAENVHARKILCECCHDFVKAGLESMRLE